MVTFEDGIILEGVGLLLVGMVETSDDGIMDDVVNTTDEVTTIGDDRATEENLVVAMFTLVVVEIIVVALSVITESIYIYSWQKYY